MKAITQFIVDNELIVLVSLFIVIILLMVLVLITDSISRKKNKQNAKELLKNNDSNIDNAFKEGLIEEDLDFTEDFSQYRDMMVIDDDEKEKVEQPSTTIEIKYVEEDEELERTKAREELKNLKEEFLKLEEEKKKQEEQEKIETPVVEPIQVIDNSDPDSDAIISLEQFNKLSDQIYEINEENKYQDEGNEPISIEELYKTREFNTEEVKKAEMNAEFNLNKEEEPKFKTSPIISPVFGLNSVEEVVNVLVENTTDIEKLSEDIRKTSEFLNMLKELRKNLE